MLAHVRANLWLLMLTLLIGCVIYPLALLVIGQILFHDRAEGSLILDKDGKVIGSRLIAQPFTADEYFQPRPSATSPSYNAAASGASNWGANNYLLRERVARQLGPIVKYRGGPRKGQPAAPDIENWFQKDRFGGKPGIVGQWAQMHSAVAQNWVKGDKFNSDYVLAWWKKEHPDTPEPRPEDLAEPFFTSYSKTYPGTFPSAVEHKTPESKTEKRIEPVKEGTDIQGIFFDMWRQEHPDADLEEVPADMVMASGSGLDPHITLTNALYQLDRVAGKWAKKTKGDPAQVRKEIENLLNQQAEAPLGGLAGVKLINVLEMNLKLRDRYESKVVAQSK